MTAKTMADVLAEHSGLASSETTLHVSCRCGARMYTTALAAHQAAALSAAGFGLVTDAKAEALEEAAALVASEEQHQWHRDSQRLPGAQIVAQRMKVLVRILRARAAALRGDS